MYKKNHNQFQILISPTGRRSSDTHFHKSTANISSKGPMILLQATKDSSEKLHKYTSEWEET